MKKIQIEFNDNWQGLKELVIVDCEGFERGYEKGRDCLVIVNAHWKHSLSSKITNAYYPLEYIKQFNYIND